MSDPASAATESCDPTAEASRTTDGAGPERTASDLLGQVDRWRVGQQQRRGHHDSDAQDRLGRQQPPVPPLERRVVASRGRQQPRPQPQRVRVGERRHHATSAGLRQRHAPVTCSTTARADPSSVAASSPPATTSAGTRGAPPPRTAAARPRRSAGGLWRRAPATAAPAIAITAIPAEPHRGGDQMNQVRREPTPLRRAELEWPPAATAASAGTAAPPARRGPPRAANATDASSSAGTARRV